MLEVNENKEANIKVIENVLGYIESSVPNPFSDYSVLKFRLNREADVKLIIKDLMGNDLKVLADGHYRNSNYVVTFLNENYSTGNYLCLLIINGQIIDTKTIQIIK